MVKIQVLFLQTTIFFIFLSLNLVSSFDMIKVDRYLEKDGLHRTFVNDLTYKIDSQHEFDNCQLISRERVSNETYIYQEELQNLKGFKFFPDWPMDIEKPASVSEPRQFLWRLLLNQSFTENDYLKNVMFFKLNEAGKGLEQIPRPDKIEFPIYVRNSVKYDYHLRYQPCVKNGTYKDVKIGSRQQMFLDCEAGQHNRELLYWSEKFRRNAMPMAPPLEDLLIKRVNQTHQAFIGQRPPPVAKMPQGNSDDLEFVRNSAVGLTFLGMMVILYEIMRKSQEVVHDFSGFNENKKSKVE